MVSQIYHIDVEMLNDVQMNPVKTMLRNFVSEDTVVSQLPRKGGRLRVKHFEMGLSCGTKSIQLMPNCLIKIFQYFSDPIQFLSVGEKNFQL